MSSLTTSGSSHAPAVGQQRVVIVGATGMVGGYTLRDALDHPAVGTVTAVGRKGLGISHPKLEEVLHQDFADCLEFEPKHSALPAQSGLKAD